MLLDKVMVPERSLLKEDPRQLKWHWKKQHLHNY